jgi:hypothetical protein
VTNVRGRSGGHLRNAPGKGDQSAGSFGTPKMISPMTRGKRPPSTIQTSKGKAPPAEFYRFCPTDGRHAR